MTNLSKEVSSHQFQEAELPNTHQVNGNRTSEWIVLTISDLSIHVVTPSMRDDLDLKEKLTMPLTPEEQQEEFQKNFEMYYYNKNR